MSQTRVTAVTSHYPETEHYRWQLRRSIARKKPSWKSEKEIKLRNKGVTIVSLAGERRSGFTELLKSLLTPLALFSSNYLCSFKRVLAMPLHSLEFI